MSETIVLYYNPMSRARIVHWMLEEIGVPYRLEVLDFDKRDHKRTGFLAVNPMGKVPTIVHRNTVITECAAICVYLADAFPASRLAPENEEPARGTYLRWIFFGSSCFEPAVVDRMLGRPQAEPSEMGYGTYDDTVNALENALTPGPYILRDRFSAADVFIGSQIGHRMMMKSLEPRPIFQSYYERLSERPAFKRTKEQTEKLVAQLRAAG